PAGSRYEAADDLGAPPEGYRDIRTEAPPPVAAPSPSSASVSTASGGGGVAVALRPRRNAPVTILTGEAGAPILRPLVAGLGRDDVEVHPVPNDYFGGTTSVTGLMVGEDLARTL